MHSWLWNYGLKQQRFGDVLQKDSDAKKKGKNEVKKWLYYFWNWGWKDRKGFKWGRYHSSRKKDKYYTEGDYSDSICSITV